MHINKNHLSEDELQLLLKRFDSTLAKFDQRGVSVFMSELLGKEERLTMAKRLAAVVLLHEEYTEYKTSRLLKLSHSTTKIIAQKLKRGSYDGTIALLKKKKLDYIKLLDTIDSILHLGGLLPHRVGLERYRSINKR